MPALSQCKIHRVIQSKRAATGFTLLELLIVIAIIGLLSSVAMGAYQGYIANAHTSKVLEHYAAARAFADTRFLQAHATLAVGGTPDLPASPAEWISEINGSNELAPSGGPAFVAGAADDFTGAVGIDFTGTFATGDAVLTLYRPAYSGITAESMTIQH